MITVVLVLAALAVGLVAGLFGAFSYAVMPGLRRGSDATFVEAMQRINVAILNPVFLGLFVGALVLTAAAAVLLFLAPAGERAALPWVLAALATYGVVFGTTSVVNVPLNDRLADAGEVPGPAAPELAAARSAYEGRWVRWNHVRTVASTVSTTCLLVALVVHAT